MKANVLNLMVMKKNDCASGSYRDSRRWCRRLSVCSGNAAFWARLRWNLDTRRLVTAFSSGLEGSGGLARCKAETYFPFLLLYFQSAFFSSSYLSSFRTLLLRFSGFIFMFCGCYATTYGLINPGPLKIDKSFACSKMSKLANSWQLFLNRSLKKIELGAEECVV